MNEIQVLRKKKKANLKSSGSQIQTVFLACMPCTPNKYQFSHVEGILLQRAREYHIHSAFQRTVTGIAITVAWFCSNTYAII